MKAHISFPKENKQLFEEAIKLLPIQVFETWHICPQVQIVDLGDDEDLFLEISHETHHHDASDLALAFIGGFMAGRKT